MEALSKIYTWDDYQKLPDDQRFEIVGGRLFAMSPGPGTRHQEIVTRLCASLHSQAKSGGCRVFVAPTDFKVSEHSVVQPDLMVVCNKEQIHEKYIDGSPSLVVEVLSPSTQAHDRVRKLRLYSQAGVGEYWLIQPDVGTLEILRLDGNEYNVALTCTAEDEFRSPTFADWTLDLGELFAD